MDTYDTLIRTLVFLTLAGCGTTIAMVAGEVNNNEVQAPAPALA